MRSEYPRYGQFVEFRGELYLKPSILPAGQVVLRSHAEKSPDMNLFRYVEKWKVWEATVSLVECSLAYEVTSKAKYHGCECQVMSISDEGIAVVYYLPGDKWLAEVEGFEQVEPGTYSKAVPVTDLYDFREEHQDLLFGLWREANFSRPDGNVA
jgi:hypothetical protein